MKNVKMNMAKVAGGLLCGLFVLSSCSEDNDDDINLPDPEVASLVATDQTVSAENTLVVESVTFPENGWLVVHRDNSGAPMVPEIISVPKLVEEGSESNVEIELEAGVTVENGETLWIMMHNDDGQMGTYEFNGSNGLDAPLQDKNGTVVMSSIVVSVAASGSFSAEDQEVNNNTVIVSNVTLAQDGFVVIHADDDGSPLVPDIISEPKFLEAGTYTDVEVALNGDVNLNDGDSIWIMLHSDTGASGEYEFDGSNGLDEPILDSAGNVVTSAIVLGSIGAVGSFTAEDQVLSQNTIIVSEATFNKNGWIVIHKDNGSGGPVVPDIISTPKLVEAGTSTDIEVELDGSASVADGETLWVMLHTDTGIEGTYEFDGSNGLDGPILDSNEEVVTSPIVVSSASITASDQAITDNQIIIDEVVAAQDGWLVIHNDDGAGNISVPDNIGMVKVTAGVNTNVVVELDNSVTYTPGQLLFPMLHLDLEPVDSYDFPGVDIPEIFGFEAENVIVTSLTVQ